MTRQLVIVRIPIRYMLDHESEQRTFEQLNNTLKCFTKEFAFITLSDESVEEFQFEYPKNSNLSFDEIDRIKVIFLQNIDQ